MLGRFVSRSTNKCFLFYNLLRGNKNFTWDQNCDVAFEKLKEYFSKPMILSKPVEGETLFLYLVEGEMLLLYLGIFDPAVSGVLILEDERAQKPIYYVSRSLV